MTLMKYIVIDQKITYIGTYHILDKNNNIFYYRYKNYWFVEFVLITITFAYSNKYTDT